MPGLLEVQSNDLIFALLNHSFTSLALLSCWDQELLLHTRPIDTQSYLYIHISVFIVVGTQAMGILPRYTGAPQIITLPPYLYFFCINYIMPILLASVRSIKVEVFHLRKSHCSTLLPSTGDLEPISTYFPCEVVLAAAFSIFSWYGFGIKFE